MSRQMKDSGIEWIGEIPETWERSHLLNVLRGAITDGPHETPNLVDKGVPFISIDSLNDSENIDFTVVKKYISEEDYLEYSKKAVLEEGDILFSKSATIGKTAIVGKEKFMIWSPLAIIKPDKKYCDTKFIYYVLNCKRLIEYASLQGSYNTQFNLGMRVLEKVFVPIPSIEEQRSIADYLDSQCAYIDAVIEKTKASIEEYKKLKQAVITQAVTKGIRGDRPMKDSGIEWIGEIPADWNIVKGHRIICSTQNGLTRRDLEKSEGHIVLKLKNMNESGYIDYSEINRIELTEREIETYRLVDGDFLFVRVNGSKKLVGKCAIYKDSGEIVAYNDHIIRVRLNDICCKDFFYWFLYSQVGKTEIELHTSTAAGQFTISGEGLRDIYVVLPNAIEQKEISKYLIEKSLSIDELIIKKEQIIEELESYKKSLIYEYVTGKKEVPVS